LTDAKTLVTSMGRTGKALDKMLKTADPLFARFDAWDRWSVTLPGHRAFDVREYTEGVKELAVTVAKMNDLIKASNELLASSEWGRRIEQVNQSADGRINVASAQSQRVVDAVFWRICLAIGVFFAMLVLYRLTTLLLTRRLRINAEKTGGPSPSDGSDQDLQRPAHPAGRGGLSS
jgi:hypothetical protein